MDFVKGLNWVVILGIVVAIETQIGNGSMNLANMVPDAWIPFVKAWAANLGSIGALIMSAGAFGQRPQGQITITPPKSAIVIALVIGAMLAFSGDAHAQGRKSSVAAPISGNVLPCDPANLLPGCRQPTVTDPATGNPVVALLSKPMTDLANFIAAGFDEAVQLSTAVPELQDGNGQACWSMMKNYSAVLKQHPIPVTFHAAADLEAIRLLNMAANKICQNAACTQVFTDAGNLINSAMPLKMPLPNLTALCSQVPGIAVVTPTQPIVPMPTPSPVPSASPTP